jgi:hypothetical protein
VSALDNAKAALDLLNEMNAQGRISYSDYSALHDLVSSAERAAPQEWEYGWRDLAGDDFIAESRGVAERFVAYWGGRALRRHPAIPATPWEPLPEDTNQTEGGRDA